MKDGLVDKQITNEVKPQEVESIVKIWDNVYKLQENVKTAIGRDEECQLVIPLCQISRQHAVVRFEGGHIGITDISSVNGTFVNGKKISANVETILKENDVITFADISLKLISV